MDGAMCPIGVVSLLFFHIYHIVNWPLNRVTKEGGRGGGRKRRNIQRRSENGFSIDINRAAFKSIPIETPKEEPHRLEITIFSIFRGKITHEMI